MEFLGTENKFAGSYLRNAYRKMIAGVFEGEQRTNFREGTAVPPAPVVTSFRETIELRD